jgi:hypothetical protein
MSNEFMYVVDAHFIDKIEKMISWTQVPVVHIITRVCTISTREISRECNDIIGSAIGSQISEKY